MAVDTLHLASVALQWAAAAESVAADAVAENLAVYLTESSLASAADVASVADVVRAAVAVRAVAADSALHQASALLSHLADVQANQP